MTDEDRAIWSQHVEDVGAAVALRQRRGQEVPELQIAILAVDARLALLEAEHRAARAVFEAMDQPVGGPQSCLYKSQNIDRTTRALRAAVKAVEEPGR